MSTELIGQSILVIEDDYLIAHSLVDLLRHSGATVVGPSGWLQDATRVAAMAPHITAALVDVNLHGEASYPAVDVLLSRGVHVVFMTGYARGSIRPAYAHCGVCTKPFTRAEILQALLPGRVSRPEPAHSHR
jgi:two-component system, response regulator PdtaR